MIQTSLPSNQKRASRFSLSSFWKLVIAVVICEATGIISGLFSRSGISTWYQTLVKPTWNPPSWIFAPVWSTLYLLMAVSLWLVWRTDDDLVGKERAMWVFAFQLFLNFWWSIIFFNLQSPGFALLNIGAMIVTISITIFLFARISKLSAYLLIPYLTWVCFATALNYSLWKLNA